MSDMKRFEDKLDKIADKITNIDTTLVKQQVILDEHVRRTNLLEEQVRPIERHVHMMQGAMKFIGAVAVMVAIIEGLLKLLGK